MTFVLTARVRRPTMDDWQIELIDLQSPMTEEDIVLIKKLVKEYDSE